MSRSPVSAALVAVFLVALCPAAVSAQSATTAENATALVDNTTNLDTTTDATIHATTTDPYASTPPVGPVEEDDDNFPWGLLGLLGLAGLLGRKRRDDDLNVDGTRDTTKRM